MQCVFALGEEYGWRGWLASPKTGWSFPQAAATQSIPWTLWHLPVVPLILSTATIDLALAYLVSIAPWAPFFLALRFRSGSMWTAAILGLAAAAWLTSKSFRLIPCTSSQFVKE